MVMNLKEVTNFHEEVNIGDVIKVEYEERKKVKNFQGQVYKLYVYDIEIAKPSIDVFAEDIKWQFWKKRKINLGDIIQYEIIDKASERLRALFEPYEKF